MPRLDRTSPSGGSTYESANKVGSHPADSLIESRLASNKAGTGRDAALSALRNDRFGSVLEKISDPRSSDALTFLRNGTEASGTDFGSALSRYAENSE